MVIESPRKYHIAISVRIDAQLLLMDNRLLISIIKALSVLFITGLLLVSAFHLEMLLTWSAASNARIILISVINPIILHV